MNLPDQHSDLFTTLNSIGLPSISRAVAWILFVCALSFGLFIAFVPWVQTTSGPGVVTALNPNDRLQEINALVSGRIDEWYVRDGAHVSVGDPIVKIVDNDPLLLERLEVEHAQLNARLDAAVAARDTADLDLTRTRQLFEQGLASRREFEQARIRVEERRASVAEAAAAISRLDVNISRQSVQTVRAPRDGVILRVNAGDAATFINSGQVVATFVPDNVERAIELYIDGRDIALVQPGDRVRLQFEGWPAVQFSGWPSVAVGTFGGLVVAVDASAAVDGRFRILAVEDPNDPNPWPDANYVRFGAKVRGWVLLNRVTVGYELWRQLNNFPPDFAARPSE